jgi:hypothetical protein
VTAVTSESIGAVVSVSELVEEFKESSVPPLHEVIVILTKKMINMTIIFFTLSSNIFCGKKLNSRKYFFT